LLQNNLAYLDYDHSYDRNTVIVLATGGRHIDRTCDTSNSGLYRKVTRTKS